jgi:hypothetical protein
MIPFLQKSVIALPINVGLYRALEKLNSLGTLLQIA